MAVPANTVDSYSARGLREDLVDIVYRIDPTEVPFTSNIGRAKATSTKHEWQVQNLATFTDSNEVAEGEDATADAATPPVRVANFTQISDKVASVTGTMEAVDKAGRESEMEYQVLLKGLELRRDVEAQLLSNKGSAAGGAGAARRSAGIEAWLTSNVSRGTGGANGGYEPGTGLVSAATDGTTRPFSEELLKTVLASVFTKGGRPKMLMLGPAQKQTFSTFSGIAQIRKDVAGHEMAVIVGAADAYVSDFGTLNVIPNIFQRNRSALVIDPRMAKMATLRPMKNAPLAKTGDTEKR